MNVRNKLKDARKKAILTQQQVADKLGITLQYYQKIEQGERGGAFEIWDALEELFSVHQKILRENHPDKEDNP